jgi:hypothetical protein
MLLDKSTFISYYPVEGRRVRMGNNSFAPILGHGTAIISLNGKKLLIQNCLHVSDLRNALHSICAHQRQHRCGFLGMYGLGMYVFFPTFILEVDTATDCHLQYAPLGRTTTLAALDYVQPKFVHDNSALVAVTLLATIKPEDNIDLPSYTSHYPKKPPPPPTPMYDLSNLPPPEYSISLKDLDKDKLIQWLYSLEHAPTNDTRKLASAPVPLECMTHDDIINKLHQPDSILPPIHPCDTSNPSNMKLHWTAEELHCITGCHQFRNYQHLVAASKDGTLINTGEFPVSIGTYATIPKSSHGKQINRTPAKYLDIAHLDIAFGDCLSVGGFKYALIFVDQGTHYNWCFGLKSLNSNDICAAFLAFRAMAGSLAQQFWCNYDEKLFGSSIKSFLHYNASTIATSLAGHQSTNVLVESHWKIMVHMSRAYLPKSKCHVRFGTLPSSILHV